MGGPKVTFLMIAYNTERYVRQAVGSVLDQTERDINILARNNGSTDGTGEILREIAANDPRVTVFENKTNWIDDKEGHFGKDGVARIWPVWDGSLLGEYISIIDSDDWLEPDFVETMYAEAERTGADMVVCGRVHRPEGGRDAKERTPPRLTPDTASDRAELVRDNFLSFYNSLRTWWGKLFRTDFFMEHYESAWRLMGGEYGAALDTAHMLRYMGKARSPVFIDKALYNFREHFGSTYAVRYPGYLNALQAEELYKAGREFMAAFSAETPENNSLLAQLQWAYFLEATPGLLAQHKTSTPRRNLSWLAVMLNNPVLSEYYGSRADDFAAEVLVYADNIFKNAGRDLTLYQSYLLRLSYVMSALELNQTSRMLYPILIGCLYDRENRGGLGRWLLDKVPVPEEFKELADQVNARAGWEPGLNISCPLIFGPDGYDGIESVRELESDLAAAMAASIETGDYGKAQALLNELSSRNPLSRDGMYFRLQLFAGREEWEQAAVLAGTAMSLWPADAEMQRLSWELMALLPKGAV